MEFKSKLNMLAPFQNKRSLFGESFLYVLLFMVCFSGFGQSTISIDDPSSVAEGDVGTATIDFTVSIDASDPGQQYNGRLFDQWWQRGRYRRDTYVFGGYGHAVADGQRDDQR